MKDFISSKTIIAKVQADFSIGSTGWFFDAKTWINDGIFEIGGGYDTVESKTVISVSDRKALLCCGTEDIISIEKDQCKVILINSAEYQKELRLSDVINSDSVLWYKLTPPYINFSFESGDVTIHYEGIPKDIEGYSMVSNNTFVQEALKFKVIYHLMMKGHPISAFSSWKEAHDMWIYYKNKASNYSVYPTPEQWDAIMRNFNQLTHFKAE